MPTVKREFIPTEVELRWGSEQNEPGVEGPPGFVLSWGAPSHGFGEFSFLQLDPGSDDLYCGDEYMAESSVRKVLELYVSRTPEDQWPPLLRTHGTVDELMKHITRWEHEG